jgi:hypothetical protein
MNLFWLAKQRRWSRKKKQYKVRSNASMMKKNVKYHCNEHVVKMPIEAVQIAYAALITLEPSENWRPSAPLTKSGKNGYRMTHKNHPLVLWVSNSRANYNLCLEYALALCREYTKRYSTPGKPKVHAVQEHAEWLVKNPPAQFPHESMTPIPVIRSGKEVIKVETVDEAVKLYRKEYRETKMRFAHYKAPRAIPSWVVKKSIK